MPEQRTYMARVEHDDWFTRHENSDELAKTISENTEYLSYKYLDEIKKLPEYIEKLDEAKELSLAIIEEKSLEEYIVNLEEWYSNNCNPDDEEGYKLQLIINGLQNIAIEIS